ncbi:hypothetical protein OAN47_03255 [Planctomycetota bacterium]|nr:hypothetical protein [Planctomycetota bacterium]
MRSLHFTLTLLSDAIVSASSGTAGGHESLSFLPGSIPLGIAAAKIYQQGDEQTGIIFHSQRVRFGDGLPAEAGHVTAPIPRTLHHPKDDSGGQIGNTAVGWAMEPGHKQFRSGHIDLVNSQMVEEPGRRTVMKTSVDESTGRARDGHLFTYETVMAGSRYQFQVDIDADVPETVDASIEKALCQGTVRVGRSRSAEFGKARIESTAAPTAVATSDIVDGRVILLAVSDIALRNPLSGAPTLEPHRLSFGLPDQARLDRKRSVITVRRYSPFHGHRRRPDLERQVIERGSVLVFEGCEGVDVSQLKSHLSAGVGDHRESGLGAVLLQPKMLSEKNPKLSQRMIGATPVVEAPDDLVFRILSERRDRLQREKQAVEICRSWENALLIRFPGKLPKSSQWGMLRTESAYATSWSSLRTHLFAEGGLLHRGVRQKAWGKKMAQQTVREFLEDQIESSFRTVDEVTLMRAVRMLGARMPKRIQIENQKGARA